MSLHLWYFKECFSAYHCYCLKHQRKLIFHFLLLNWRYQQWHTGTQTPRSFDCRRTLNVLWNDYLITISIYKKQFWDMQVSSHSKMVSNLQKDLKFLCLVRVNKIYLLIFFLKNLFLFFPLLTEWSMLKSTAYTHFVMYILSFSRLSGFNFKVDVNSISYRLRPT